MVLLARRGATTCIKGAINCMAELKDIRSSQDVSYQMSNYSITCEMLADYIQDLKKHVKTLDSGDDSSIDVVMELQNLDKAQHALYEAAKYLGSTGYDVDKPLTII